MEAGKVINPWNLFVGCMVPNFIKCRTELSTTAKLLYGQLAQCCGNDGIAIPSIGYLSCELGVSRSAIDRAISELKTYKLVLVRRRGLSMSNQFFFLSHEWMQELKSNPEELEKRQGRRFRNVKDDVTVTPSTTHIRESVRESIKREVHASRAILRTDREQIDPLYAGVNKRVG